jgi:hypothetical protein
VRVRRQSPTQERLVSDDEVNVADIVDDAVDADDVLRVEAQPEPPFWCQFCETFYSSPTKRLSTVELLSKVACFVKE